MAGIEEVEMGKEIGDAVIDINATTEIFKEGTTTLDDQLRAFVQQKLDAVPGEPLEFRPFSITRVPAWFHEADKTYYDPKVVSFGPYHHGKEELRAMEEYKWSTLRDFLARNNEVSFDNYFKEIRALETRARMCYSESVKMSSDEFVMMLMLDGCFLLEFFLKPKYQQRDCVVFGTTWVKTGICVDMLLLENQMPFFIIHKLFVLVHSGGGQDCKSQCGLFKLFLQDFPGLGYKQKLRPPQEPCDEIQHFLHLYHTCMVADLAADFTREIMEQSVVSNQSHSFVVEIFAQIKSWFYHQSKRAKEEESADRRRSKEENSTEGRRAREEQSAERRAKKKETDQSLYIIPCVSELYEAGVTFARKKESRDMFDISFKNGIMEMPLVYIEIVLKIILSNLVAFEQSQTLSIFLVFTRYLALMDALVNTEKDVAILQQSGILQNFLQNEEDASVFYNHFGDFNLVDYDDDYFQDLFSEVRKYGESSWHKYRAKLMHDYFNNPWAIISVVAGGVLLILTVVQTYYTIYSSIHN